MAADDTPRRSATEADTPGAVEVRSRSDGRRSLLVFGGGGSSMFQLPERGTVVIGRQEGVDLQLADAGASRQHARLEIDAESLRLVDLGSQNGTYINRERVSGERIVIAGDVITVSSTTMIVHAAAPAHAPAIIVDDERFRVRLEDELERSVRYGRNFALLVLRWDDAPSDRAPIRRAIEGQLRRIDAAVFVGPETVHIVLAEASALEANAFVARLRARLDTPNLRIGVSTCPADGADLDALITHAGNAASLAKPGATITAECTHQTLAVGDKRVIVADPAVVRLYALIDRLAPVDLPVLIIGETGCGKELAATAIHARSRRRSRQLITLNSAAIPETLVESELFGHEKGAFSGAVATKTGLLEAADGSTLFLDEIGELALPVQAKLLRAIETGRFTRLGDVREREVDVRFVAATHRELEVEVREGRFRQDLYFRLSGAILRVPSLRERPRELPLLATTFLEEACARAKRAPMRITEPAMDALRAHSWPGNVRELKNLIQYVAAAHPEPELTAAHVEDRLAMNGRATAGPSDGSAMRPLAEEIRELEIARMRTALELSGGNLTRAAMMISVPIRTFSEKVKTYGLERRKK